MSLLPDDDKARKMIPIFRYLTRYFPKAQREITKVCVVNNVRYNPDRDPADISWARGKSPDQLGSAFRHMLESAVDGKVFEEVPAEVAELTGIGRVYVLAEAAWRIQAALELAIEEQESEAALQELAKPEHQYCPPFPDAALFVREPRAQTLEEQGYYKCSRGYIHVIGAPCRHR